MRRWTIGLVGALAALVALAACGEDGGAFPAGDTSIDAAHDADVPERDGTMPEDAGADGGNDATIPDASDGSDADAEDAEELPDAEDGSEDTGPAAVPEILVTVAGIPAAFNGSLPYTQNGGPPRDFRLRVNRENAPLDVLLTPGSGPVDWDTLVVDCGPGIGLPDPVPHPELPGRRLHFDAATPLPEAAGVACEATVAGPGGMASDAIIVEAATMPAALDPFATVDPWLVLLGRDQHAVSVEAAEDGSFDVVSTFVEAGNGVPDLEESFALLGLMSPDAPEAAAMVRARLLAVVRDHAYRIFGLDPAGAPTPGGVRVQLWFEGDEGAPTAGEAGVSLIALGGDGTLADQGNNLVGKANIDWNNQQADDNSVHGRGIYTISLARQILREPLAVVLFGQLLPMTGDPIGTLPGDAAILAPGFDPLTSDDPEAVERFELMDFMVRMGGLAVASTLCHEMGHSLGLVPLGPPPEGLFGGMDGLDVTVNDVNGAHIDTDGLNVMQTGAVTNWVEAVSQVPVFNALNMAYLQRQLVVGDAGGSP